MNLDTNILIAYLAGENGIVEPLNEWIEKGGVLYVSTIVETELLSFSGWTVNEEAEVDKFLEENFISIPYDRNIARMAAKLRKDSKIKLPDAAIAATALFTNTPLVTRNEKDFKKIKELQVLVA